MKIVLLVIPWAYRELKNPSFRKNQRHRSFSDVSGQGILFSYGLLQIASVLRADGHDVCFIESYLTSTQEIIKKIVSCRPEAVGVNTPTCLWETTKIFLKDMRRCLPECFLFLGGAHAVFAREKCLEESIELDSVVIGEEYVACELMRRISLKLSIEGIPGVISRGKSKITEDRSLIYVQNLDELPFPAYDLVNFQKYIPNITFLHKLPFAHIFTSRGCSLQCGFCPYPGEKPLRFKSAGYLRSEIEYLVSSFGVKTINFYDDCNIFSHHQNEAYIFCDLLRSLKRRPQWSIYLVDFRIGKDLLLVMKNSGCFRINCGIESGVQENRDAIRGECFPLEKIAEKVREIKKIGISTVGKFQFGIPSETYRQGLKTIDFACSLPLDYAYFIRLLLMPGSKMFDAYFRMGRINPDTRTWNAYADFFEPDGMNLQELSSLIRIGYQQFYRRPSWWLSAMTKYWNYGIYARYLQRIIMKYL